MDKKKVLKIVCIAVVIIVVLFGINLGRKMLILSKYTDKWNENSKISNFYIKKNDNGQTSEFWRKGNQGLLKLTAENDDVRMIHFGEEYNWIIVDSKEGKTAVKMAKEEGAVEIQPIVSGTLYMENFWDTLKMAFSSRITTEKINDIECYKIYLAKEWQMYVNKNDYLPVREINGSTDTGIIEYKLNSVKDEEVILPNLAGYNINDTTQQSN